MSRLSLPRLDERGRGVNAEVERGVGGGDVLAGNVVQWSASEVAAHGREGIA